MEFERLKELLVRNRSYRRFDQSRRIEMSELERLVDLSRYCGSGRNLQPLKYRIVNSEEECAEIFGTLGWAGYLTDWVGPEEGERPSAYIVQLLDRNLTESLLCDDGLQLEAVSLGAVASGYGGCIIKSFNAGRVSEILSLPGHLEPRYIFALGVPVEEVVMEPMERGEIKYWRDGDQKHHVPKRGMEEILVK